MRRVDKQTLPPLPRKGISAEAWYWVSTFAWTAVACLVAWRLSVALSSGLVLCAAYAVPAAISLRSLRQAFASLCVVTIVGVVLLSGWPAGVRLSFLIVGVSFAMAALYITMVAGEKLGEVRSALREANASSETSEMALQRAGVCVVVVSRNLTWVSANEAAWNAVGSDARLRRGLDASVEMDVDAATALMHSASRDSWSKFFSAALADAAREPLAPGQSLPSYRVNLYDIAGRLTMYRFTATRGHNEELVFVGYPDGSHWQPQEQTAQEWFGDAARSMSEPSVIIESDGTILASNDAFNALCGARGKARYIFECPNVIGAEERLFATNIWMPTRKGATDLPRVSLAGAGPAVGARVAPPSAAYLEAVLVMFKARTSPIPKGFAEITKPMELT